MYYDGNSLFCPSIGNALIEALTFLGKDEHNNNNNNASGPPPNPVTP
jgi:hypothetical protein